MRRGRGRGLTSGGWLGDHNPRGGDAAVLWRPLGARWRLLHPDLLLHAGDALQPRVLLRFTLTVIVLNPGEGDLPRARRHSDPLDSTRPSILRTSATLGARGPRPVLEASVLLVSAERVSTWSNAIYKGDVKEDNDKPNCNLFNIL